MKASYFIPPVATLVLVGAWNLNQMRSISTLEEERASLRTKIAETGDGSAGADFLSARRSAKATVAGGKDKIDWKLLSAQLIGARQSGGVGDTRAMMLFQQRLEKMSEQEMADALDEISGMDLPADARSMLESILIDPLIGKDPELALARFADRIQSDPDGIGLQLSSALKEWAKNDLTAATAWFDKQIAAGTFESKTLDARSDVRLQFEGALLESLLSSDPHAAANRLSDLPEDQRREVLQQIPFDGLPEQSRYYYTNLVRILVPADERAGSFAHIASELVTHGGFSDVGKFLDAVNATREERSAAAMDAANSRLEQLGQDGKVTARDVDAMREWLKIQAPDQLDRITGKALAEASQERGEFKFDDAARLALQYQQSSGNDDVLAAFLESYSARSNLEEARHLADRITDPARRDEILKGLK